jgi:hypothetical protein
MTQRARDVAVSCRSNTDSWRSSFFLLALRAPTPRRKGASGCGTWKTKNKCCHVMGHYVMSRYCYVTSWVATSWVGTATPRHGTLRHESALLRHVMGHYVMSRPCYVTSWVAIATSRHGSQRHESLLLWQVMGRYDMRSLRNESRSLVTPTSCLVVRS